MIERLIHPLTRPLKLRPLVIRRNLIPQVPKTDSVHALHPWATDGGALPRVGADLASSGLTSPDRSLGPSLAVE